MRKRLAPQIHSGSILRSTLMTSVSAMSLGIGIGMNIQEAHAVCVTGANITTCTGDVSAGVPDLTDPVDTLIIESTTTVLGGRSISLFNNNSPSVTVNADFSPQGLINDPSGFGLTTQTGIGIRADADGATADVTLIGDITVQAGPDENAVNSLLTDRDAGVLIESRGEMNVVQTGDVTITAGSQTVTSDNVAATDTQRFSGIALTTEPVDFNNFIPADLTLTRAGNLSFTGPQMTATSTDAIGSNRVIVNNVAGSEERALYGLLGIASGDITINNMGNIELNSGELTGTTSSVGGRAESIGAGFFMIGFGLPNRPNTPFAVGAASGETPRSENVFIRNTGDINVNIGTRTFSATSQTQTGDDPSEAVVQFGTGFLDPDRAFGVRIDTPLNLDAVFDGDITVNGGMTDVTANALAGPDMNRGLVSATGFGTDVQGAFFRGETIFTENDTDNDGMAVVTIDGAIMATGGSVEGDVGGTGFAPRPVTSFPPPPGTTAGEIVFAGGDASGISIANFRDETTISANPATMSRSIETVSQIELNLTGPIATQGGDANVTISGADLAGRFEGGEAFAIGTSFDPIMLNTGLGTSISATGGDATVTLNGSHGQQSVRGGRGSGGFFSIQSNTDSTFALDFTVTGGNATLTGDAGTALNTTTMENDLSFVVGGEGLGINFGLRPEIFPSEFDALTEQQQQALLAARLFYTGDVIATGGNAIANDPDAVAAGGEAIGIRVNQATNLVLQGNVTATAGAGTSRDGQVVGIEFDRFGAFFPGFLPLDTVASSIRVEGNVMASGQGFDTINPVADPTIEFFGADFSVDRNFSAGVRAISPGLVEVSVANGGTVTTNGDLVHGIVAASEKNTVIVENGGNVLAQGMGANGIEVRPYQDIDFAIPTQAQVADVSIAVENGGTVTSLQGTGINDDDRRLAVDFTQIGNPRIVENFENETNADIAGTVTGGNGTAIDLGSGEDRLMLRSTATLNGMTTLGDGEDRFSFEDGFTSTGMISGGDGMDIIEADVAMMTTRNLDLAPLPLESFEIIEKEGAGTLNILGAAIPDPILLQANAGLSQILTSQMNLSADIAPGANLITQATMAHVTNGGSFSIGMNPLGDIATVQLTGNLVQEATGVLHVDIERPNMADLIEVDGSTTLDGTLNVNALGMLQNFVVGDEFIIIESAGGVVGEFATITDNLPDLDVTANIIPDGMTAQNVVLGLSAGDPSDKSVHPNALQAGARAGGEFTDIVQTRARTTGSGGNAPSSGTFALALLTDLSTASGELDAVTQSFGADGSLPEGMYAWVTGYGAERDVDGSAAITGYDASLGGLAFGVDSVFTHDNALVTLGLTGGYSNTDVDSGPSSSDIETWHVGAYGSLEKDGWLFTGAIAYGFQDYDFSRSIPVGMASVTANGDADGRVFSASLAASHDIAAMLGFDDNTTVAPLVRFDHVSADRDGFTETGAGVLNLTVADDDFTQNFISIGFETSTIFEIDSGVLAKPNLEVRWEHAFSNDNAVGNSAIAGVAGATFSSAGAIEDNNRAVVGAGIEIDMSETFTANINYNGTFSSGFSDHRASAGIRMKF